MYNARLVQLRLSKAGKVMFVYNLTAFCERNYMEASILTKSLYKTIAHITAIVFV